MTAISSLQMVVFFPNLMSVKNELICVKKWNLEYSKPSKEVSCCHYYYYLLLLLLFLVYN